MAKCFLGLEFNKIQLHEIMADHNAQSFPKSDFWKRQFLEKAHQEESAERQFDVWIYNILCNNCLKGLSQNL